MLNDNCYYFIFTQKPTQTFPHNLEIHPVYEKPTLAKNEITVNSF